MLCEQSPKLHPLIFSLMQVVAYCRTEPVRRRIWSRRWIADDEVERLYKLVDRKVQFQRSYVAQVFCGNNDWNGADHLILIEVEGVFAVYVGDGLRIEKSAGERQSEKVVRDGHSAFAVTAAPRADTRTVGLAPSDALDVAFLTGVSNDDALRRRVDKIVYLKPQLSR